MSNQEENRRYDPTPFSICVLAAELVRLCSGHKVTALPKHRKFVQT